GTESAERANASIPEPPHVVAA
ncbi:MAG: hypothetical protein AMXMBFR83_22260, partial [Phycisphaerae bacterium]